VRAQAEPATGQQGDCFIQGTRSTVGRWLGNITPKSAAAA